jgi:trans-aconitate methyltransferase
MTLTECLEFLRPSGIPSAHPSVWADLGCGSGLFTHALATLLAPGSQVRAVDAQHHFRNTGNNNEVDIHFGQADFVTDDLPFRALDGILMANALHYVKDKKALIQKLQLYCKQEGKLVIIEYDTNKANPWVPYPVPFDALRTLFLESGYKSIRKTNERPSVYGPAKMYAVTISI